MNDTELLMRKLRRQERLKALALTFGICIIWFTIIMGVHSATNVSGIANTAVTGNVVVGGDVIYRSSIGGIPSGSILMFTTSCPSGWTRLSAYDGSYLRLSTTAGSTGGSSTHTHTFSHDHGAGSLSLASGGGNHQHGGSGTLNSAGDHLHTDGVDATCTFDGTYGFWKNGDLSSVAGAHTHTFIYGTQFGGAAHTHSLTGTSGSASPTVDSPSNNPIYVNVVLCKKG